MAVDSGLLGADLAGLDALEQAERSRESRARRLWAAAWPKLAALAVAVAVWQAVVWSHWRPAYVLPGPGTVGAELLDQIGQPVFWRALATTIRRALTGYSLAIVVGSLIGLSVVRVRLARTAVGSLITGLQSMPSIAWFPLAILLFKLSEGAILFVLILGAAPSIAAGLIGGVDHVPPVLVRSGRTLGARGIALYRHVILPAALPSFVTGLKQAWAFAWRSLMAGELLVIVARRPSLGTRLQFARENSDAPSLLALMIVILAIGVVVDTAFGAADRSIRGRWGLVDESR